MFIGSAPGCNNKIRFVSVFIHFPPKGKPKKLDFMDMNRVGFESQAIVKFIADRSDIQIKIYRPPDYFKVGLLVAFVVLVRPK